MITIDTSILIDIQHKKEKTIKKLQEIKEVHEGLHPLLFIPYFEFIEGLQELSEMERKTLGQWIESLSFIAPTKKTANILAKLKRKYERIGEAVSLANLMIASQAIENNLVIITRDKGFKNIEEVEKIILD